MGRRIGRGGGVALAIAIAWAAAQGCEDSGGQGAPGLVDAGHGPDAGVVDGGAPVADAGSRDPEVVRQPDAGTASAAYKPTTLIEIATGGADDQVSVTSGAADEPPRGPESFDIDGDGNVVILDSPGAAVKVFTPQKTLLKRVDLGIQGSSFVDCSVSGTGDFALAHAADHRVHVLPKAASSLADATRRIDLPRAAAFDGVAFNTEGKLFARTAGQWTYAIDGGPSDPFLALLSMHAPMFVRVRRVGAALGVLYASSVYQSDGYSGNAQRKFEIAPGVSIGSISFIDADAKGRAFVHIESVEDGPTGAMSVRRFFMRVGAAPADWTAPVEIPADTYAFPFRDLRVGADGSVYAMLVYQDRVKVIRWTAE